eukprot:jgi/Ulvmu1/11027/UM007_0207.1
MVQHEVNSKPAPPVPGVEVVRLPGKGRGMRATASFKPGDLIIDEEPFAAVAMTDILEGEPVCHSDFAMVQEEDLKRCVACKRVRYSSKAAQKVDWARGHKYECKALRSPQVRPMSMLRLMARVLWKRGAMMKADSDSKAATEAPAAAAGQASLDESMQSTSNGEHRSTESSSVGYWESFEAVAALQANPGSLGAMPRPALMMMLQSLRFYLSQTKAPHNSDEALQEKLLLQLMSNAFSINEAGHGLTLGLALFPVGSVLNHSSRPNCGQAFFKGRLQIRAIKAIQPGEELEISYTSPEEPTFLQRNDLLARYCFELRPDLPKGLKFKEARTQKLGGCIHASVLNEIDSGKLLLDGIDAAHCAVLGDPAAVADSRASGGETGLAPGATRFCSVKVMSDSEFDFGGMGLGPMGVPGEDSLESSISLVAARQILREAWLPDGVGAAWLDQVMKDRWRVDAVVFGDWPTAPADEWVAAVYAATFAAAAHAWSDSLRERDETDIARRLLLKADAAGREAGLADSHIAMRPLLAGLMDIFLHQPMRQKLPTAPPTNHETENCIIAHRHEHALRAIYPEGYGDIGFDLDKVAEVAGRCGGVAYAARLWSEAAARLRGAFGAERLVMRVVFKAEYFKDEDMERRAELIERFGPYLPREFTQAAV